ncbi:MAG: AAA family ATPase, partial [Spirochaetota bacterium]
MFLPLNISNYKSIDELEMELGDVTVLIGENGCGKSNILEAIAFGSAAAKNKLDNVFLHSRGIRVTEPKFMRSAFDRKNQKETIKIVLDNNTPFEIYYNQKENSWGNRLVEKAMHSVFNSPDPEITEALDTLKKEPENIQKLERLISLEFLNLF